MNASKDQDFCFKLTGNENEKKEAKELINYHKHVSVSTSNFMQSSDHLDNSLTES